MKYFSKLGLFFVGIYVLITLVIFVRAHSCVGAFCGLPVIIPAMPWLLIVKELTVGMPGNFWIFIFYAVNTGIVYGIGSLIGNDYKLHGSALNEIMEKIKEYKGIIILILVVLAGAFYWYEWRPEQIREQIRKTCAKKAINTRAIGEVPERKPYTFKEETDIYEQIYKQCLKENDLEK